MKLSLFELADLAAAQHAARITALFAESDVVAEMPLNEVGPRDTTPEGTDTITSNHHEAGNADSTQPGLWPQEWHADLGLVDDGDAAGADA